MGEYDRKQQKQESRAIAYNGGGSKQLKEIIDNKGIPNTYKIIGQLKPVRNKTLSERRVTQLGKPEEDKAPFVEGEMNVETGLLGKQLGTDRANRRKKGKPDRKAEYLFHSTTYYNLLSIIENGLDPSKGGTECGASMLAVGKLQADSLKGSSGFIHGATRSVVALHYAKKYFERERKKREMEIAGLAVVLRFKVNSEENWTEDTEDKRGNYKTRQSIPVADIEYLDIEMGWRPLIELNKDSLHELLIGIPSTPSTPSTSRGIKTSTFINLCEIDFSGSDSLTPESIVPFVQAIEDGELPFLRLLILKQVQINSDQKQLLSLIPNLELQLK